MPLGTASREPPSTSAIAPKISYPLPAARASRHYPRQRVHHAGMGFWVPRPTLDRGERVGATIFANHTQGARAVGGRLFVTDRNLRFVANRFDRITRGQDIAIPRGAVESIEVADRSMRSGPFSGGLRRRIHVVTSDGGELFVVNKAELVAERLRAWASKAPN